jgi:ubiquinol-cytochrome c reductase cytochrome b subunit
MNQVQPNRISRILWVVTVSSFVMVAVTGLFILFFYDPSRPYESTLELMFDVRGGLLVYQLHNWASSLMIAALIVHLLSLFFTGAFRGARGTWVLLFLILFSAMALGLSGSVLADDLLSTNSLAVLNGVTLSIPFAGTWLSSLIFQGAYPSGAIATFYPLHFVVFPLLVAGLIAVVIWLGPRRRPTATEIFRTAGVAAVAVGVLIAISATVTINPVATYGPADPGNASAGAGAVWYLAFLDGALRLAPSGWEFVWAGHTWTLAILVPLAVCGVFFVAAIAYPFVESWITGARAATEPDRPRNMPTRTALGVAGIVFYGVLWAAAGADTIAFQFRLGAEGVLMTLQLALLAGPPIAFLLTKRICLGLQRRDRDIALHGFETGRVVRLPGGRYVEVHQAVSAAEQRRLVGHESPEPFTARPDRRGVLHVHDKVRAVLSRWMYGDRFPTITQGELESGRHVG